MSTFPGQLKSSFWSDPQLRETASPSIRAPKQFKSAALCRVVVLLGPRPASLTLLQLLFRLRPVTDSNSQSMKFSQVHQLWTESSLPTQVSESWRNLTTYW